MNIKKKWLAAVLCAVVLLAQMSGAMAAQAQQEDGMTVADALEAGREATVSTQFAWQPVASLDEEKNNAAAALLDAVTFEGRMATLGDAGEEYIDATVKISDRAALHLAAVATEEAQYYHEDTFGMPLVLRYDEMEALMTKYAEHTERRLAEGEDPELAAQYSAAITQVYTSMVSSIEGATAGEGIMTTLPEAESFEELQESIGLTKLVEAAVAWFEENIKIVAQDEPFETISGAGLHDRAEVVTITGEQLADYLKLLTTELSESDEYWKNIVQAVAQYDSSLADADAQEEFLATVPMVMLMLREQITEMIPEETTITISNGYDGDTSTIRQIAVHMYDATTEEIVDFQGTLEWMVESAAVYGLVYPKGVEGDASITLVVEPRADTEDGLEDDGFMALLSIYEGQTPVTQLGLQTSSVMQREESGSTWNGSVQVGVSESSLLRGAALVAASKDLYDGVDIKRDFDLEFSVIDAGEEMPAAQMRSQIQTGPRTEPPFDIHDETIEFVNPASMTDAEFDRWMEDVRIHIESKMYGLPAYLPQEAQALFSADE